MKRLGAPLQPQGAALNKSIRFKDLVKFRILGVGTFGKVWLVSHKRSGTPYALKLLSKREIIGHHQVEGVIREKNIMASLDHPFVVNLVSTFQDERNLYMLIELVQGGELFSVIHTETRDGIPNGNSRFYAACILESLAHLHHRSICYRDLKPENILIDSKGYCVLVDLGFAKIVVDKTYTL
jgi:protein kinase A